MQQISKINKSALKQLEYEIQVDYDVNKYQIRYLFSSLLHLKPHYEILGKLIHTRNIQSNSLFERKQQKDNVCFGVEIYDSKEKIHKHLQIYLLNTFSSKTSFQTLHSMASQIQSFGHTDLILQLLDFYGLDQDSIEQPFNDHEFFIAEFEMFDMSLQEYEQILGEPVSDITILGEKQLEYCLQISGMTKSEMKSSTNFVYLMSQDSGKIKLKINLLPICSSQDINCILDYYNSHMHQLLFKKENNVKTQLDEARIIAQSKREAFKQQVYEQTENINFVELFQQMDLTITKKDFISSLLSKNPHALKLHGESIFRIISENPKYQEFEIIEMNTKKFIFKALQIDGKISYLEGKKCASLSEAQQLLRKCQKLIESSLIHQITTITNVKLIETGEEGYSLLLENINRGISGDNKHYNLVEFLRKQSNELGDIFGEMYEIYLYEFVKLIYHLFTQHDIQIQRLNPLNIFVTILEDNQDDQQIQILVSDIDESEDYSYFSLQFLLSFLENNPLQSDHQRYLMKLLTEFFDCISSRKINECRKIYQKIEKSYSQNKVNKSLEKSALEYNIVMNINYEIEQFDKSNVYIKEFSLAKQPLVFFTNLMNSLSLNYLYWNPLISFESIFFSKKPEKQSTHLLSNEQQGIIKSFYESQQGQTEQQQQRQIETTEYELNYFMKTHQMQLNLSIEKIQLEFQDLVVLNTELKEEKNIDHLEETFSSSQLCLRISFSEQDKSEGSSSIKFIMTDNKFIVILSESPLIVQCNEIIKNQNSAIIFSLLDQYFLRAQQYQTLKDLCPSKSRNNLLNDIPLVLLLITKEIRNLKSFGLNLKTEDYEKFENYKTVLSQHKSLQNLTICLDYLKHNNNNQPQGRLFGGNNQLFGGLFGMNNQNQGGLFDIFIQPQGGLFGGNNQQIGGLFGQNQYQNNAQANLITENDKNMIAKQLQQMINESKSLNTLLVKVKNNREENNVMILKSKIYKCARLVKIDIPKRDMLLFG